MSVSIFSFFMAFIWFNFFVLLSVFFRRATGFVLQFSIWSLFALTTVSVLRLCMSFELPFVIIINSRTILPSIQMALRNELFTVAGKSVNLAVVFLFIWISVALALLMRLYVHILRDYNTIRDLHTETDERVRMIMTEAAACLGRRADYSIKVSSDITIPMMSGYFKPHIILPTTVSALSDSDIKNILLHECQHFLQKDIWVKLIINILCCLFWWNPLIYLFKVNLDQTLEIKCDMQMIKGMSETETVGYLESLLAIAKHSLNTKRLALKNASRFISISGNSATVQRFTIIAEYKTSRQKLHMIMFVIILTIMLCLSYMFIIQPHNRP